MIAHVCIYVMHKFSHIIKTLYGYKFIAVIKYPIWEFVIISPIVEYFGCF